MTSKAYMAEQRLIAAENERAAWSRSGEALRWLSQCQAEITINPTSQRAVITVRHKNGTKQVYFATTFIEAVEKAYAAWSATQSSVPWEIGDNI